MEILKIENLNFTYPLCGKKALDGISFTAERGDFISICGATGSGKSTLLRMLKRELAPVGEKSGSILLHGIPVQTLSDRDSAAKIGYVAQHPEQQIVTDRVWHELAFGLENLGIEKSVIRRRVSEIACYFDIEDWFEKNTSELSGGQKQLLNLASVMVMQPEIIILDEPTAQLDPIAASGFIDTLKRLNRELSLTVIIAEHSLEEVIPASNRLLALDKGKLLVSDETHSAVGALCGSERLADAMPSAVRLYREAGAEGNCPLDVREGRTYIENNFKNDTRSLNDTQKKCDGKPSLQFDNVYFRYSRKLPDVLRGLNFTVYDDEIFCIVGGNASGKSTALSAAAGLIKAYSGNIRVFGKKINDYKGQELYNSCLAMLPQDVSTVFLKNTVREELFDAGIAYDALPFDITPLLERHPYDISGGEQQLVALAKALAAKPRLLLLDEPTKGLDAFAKRKTADMLRDLRKSGMTIVIVTHDVEFAAGVADRCAMFFRGEITSCDTPRRFFAANSFYTTAVSRMTRGYYDGAVTIGDVTELCRINGRKTVW